MHVFERDGSYILYNEDTLEFYTLKSALGKKLIELGDDYISTMTEDKEEEKIAPTYKYSSDRISRLVLVISQDCNLGCKYCYAQQGNYGEENGKFMSFDVLKNTIKFAISRFPKGIEKIQFFGGEPLLNFELMKKGCEWITDYFAKNELSAPQFTIVTNGTIMNEEIRDFLNKYSFMVTISLDGNKDVNDVNRVYKNSNKSVFDEVKKNIEFLNESRKYPLTVEMTIDKRNIQQFVENKGNVVDLEEIHMLGVDSVHLVPAVWGNCRNRHDEYMEDMKKYFDTVTKYSANSLETPNPISLISLVDYADRLIHKKKKEYFCAAGIDEFSVNTQGDIYPCFTFIGKRDFLMGNVNEANNDAFERIQSILKENIYSKSEKCSKCWAKGMCSNCIGNSLLVNGDISEPVQEICEVERVQLERTLIECNKKVLRETDDV